MTVQKIKSSNKKDFSSHKCYLCGGKSVHIIEPITYKGKTIYIDGEKCQKCGEFFSSLEESDRIRKELNPTLIERVKRLFIHSKSQVDKPNKSFFDKVL